MPVDPDVTVEVRTVLTRARGLLQPDDHAADGDRDVAGGIPEVLEQGNDNIDGKDVLQAVKDAVALLR